MKIPPPLNFSLLSNGVLSSDALVLWERRIDLGIRQSWAQTSALPSTNGVISSRLLNFSLHESEKSFTYAKEIIYLLIEGKKGCNETKCVRHSRW